MELTQDLRLAVRDLARRRGYTAAAVLTLALAIGTNSAVFSTVYAVLLKPLPIHQPQNLVICWERDPRRNLSVVELSYRNVQDWTAGSQVFVRAAAVGSSTWPVVLDGPDRSLRLSSAGVSASFFETLGVTPELGRGFHPEDDLPNAPPVVVLSHRLWVTRFGADPGAVGTTIRLGQPSTVVGVLPEAFDFPRGTDVWRPIVPILARAGNGRVASPLESVGVLFLLGRLREGVTPGLAAEQLDRLAARLAQAGSAPRFGAQVVVSPFLDYLVGPARQILWMLSAVVGVLLLIGCVNVSGLLLAQASLSRRRDAIRRALGASRARLGWHWALEVLILSVAGAILGLIASWWIVRGIVAFAPGDVPRLSNASINLPVAGFTLAAMLAAALLCGMESVRQAAASDPALALNDAAPAISGGRSKPARSLLVIIEVALSVGLLVAAGLVVRSFTNLRRVDLGFIPSNVLTMRVGPRDARPSTNAWMNRLLARVVALRGVEAAGAVTLRPLALGPIGQETWVILEGQPDTPRNRLLNPVLNYQVATPGYFEAMRIRLRRGRLFNDEDNLTSPRVALVGQSTARRLWPGEDPVGRRILMPTHSPDGGPGVWRTVVGVVGDVRYRGIDDVRLDVYDAARQSPWAATDLVVRTSRDPLSVAADVETAARRLDPRVVIDRVTTMDAVVSREIAPWRFSGLMFTLFAALAFVLAAVGLFSLVSLEVTNRSREFAVRVALGAERRDVRRRVFLAALRHGAPGLVLGLLVAVGATRAMRHLLFEVQPLDVTTYLTVSGFVCAVVVVAAWLPAHRAAAVDPLALLRRE